MLAVVAVAANAAGGDGGETPQGPPIAPVPVELSEVPQAAVTQPTSPNIIFGESANIGEGVIIGGTLAPATGGGGGLLEGVQTEQAPAAAVTLPVLPQVVDGPQVNQAVIPTGLAADPQTPTGKFTTAAEVRPILDATRANRVAVRAYDGKDLIYVTHLWAWRCGLKAMAISVTDEPLQNWPLPECHMNYSTPNAILDGDVLPYLSLRLGGVQSVTIQVVYDDLSTDIARFERGEILIP